MNRKAKLPFDPKDFRSKVNGGQRVSEYRKEQIVFRQGDPADAVFYIHNGKAKKTVISEQGKEAVVALSGPATSSARAAWLASDCVCRRSLF
jgi:CRP/FNR family transcriptional regulator, cyclic AMP receptor protein